MRIQTAQHTALKRPLMPLLLPPKFIVHLHFQVKSYRYAGLLAGAQFAWAEL